MIYIVTRVRLPISKINDQIVSPLFAFCLFSSIKYGVCIMNQVFMKITRGEGVEPR